MDSCINHEIDTTGAYIGTHFALGSPSLKEERIGLARFTTYLPQTLEHHASSFCDGQ